MSVSAPIEMVMTQFADKVNIIFVSRIIKGISRALQVFQWYSYFNIFCVTSQKLLKYFNGTAISTSAVLPAAGVLSAILALNINDSESAILSMRLSLRYCHKLSGAFA